ncbi:MAG: hypothetical protein WC787_02720 [Patescibacteria group bacterium]|jgi:hypothetical protein
MMETLWLFVVLVTILFHGHLLGRRLFPTIWWGISLLPGIVLMIALQSLIQTGWYYSGYPLGWISDIVSLALAAAVCHALIRFTTQPSSSPTPTAPFSFAFSPRHILGAALLIIALLATILIHRSALLAGTTDSIRTPWPLLPERTLWLIALTWTMLIASVAFVRSRLTTTLHAALATSATLWIAPLLYRIGYGFDGFLHIASEKILLATGTLHPKPLYYIGQYVFTTWFARLSHFSIADVDRWLLPVAAAMFLPLAVLITLPKKSAVTPFLAFGVLPLGAFVASTPQGFAYLLGLCAILLARNTRETHIHPSVSLILASWAVATHPLAGIPFLFVALALLTYERTATRYKILSPLFSILAGISIPLMFVVLGLKGGTTIAWNPDTIFSIEPWRTWLTGFVPTIGNHFVLWPAWASLASHMLPLILVVLAFIGGKSNRPLLLSALMLWLSGTALKATGDFTFLIDYERGNYADRLNTLALLCLFPAAVTAFQQAHERLRQTPRPILVALSIFFITFATGIAYDSLPRHDALVTGRGWTTSRADIEAVRLIDSDANGRDYTVLANQSVSAAAVATLGFKRYADDVFFYPIPTGGPLYELYLKMTYNEPSRDTVKDAARLGKTDLVYIVLNNYWWRAPQVAESIRAIADKQWDIETGTVRVYRFDVSNEANASTTAVGR